MSSSWVAEFDNEEDYNHFVARYKEIAPNGGNVIVPDLPENPDQVRLRGAWVDIKHTILYFCENFDEDIHGEPPVKDPAWAVMFDIAIWDDWTKDFICCIMQEMCHRYSFVEIGCTSSDLVSAEEFLKRNVFHQFKMLIKHYGDSDPDELHFIFGMDKEVRTKDFDKLEKDIDSVEKAFRAAAKRFFDGDASDLILTFEEEV